MTDWDGGKREAVLQHLRKGSLFRAFLGSSTCRMCSRELGNHEYTDGAFAWPEGLDHYVAEHDVKLPDDFVEACLSPNKATPAWLTSIQPEIWMETGPESMMPADPRTPSRYVVDEGPWLQWAALNTPARPSQDALSLGAARELCQALSHAGWQAEIDEVNERWRLRYPWGAAEEVIYVQRCARPILERRLLRKRRPDPGRLLAPEQTRVIAAEYDGPWGAARVVAEIPSKAWVVLVKMSDVGWPEEKDARDVLDREMRIGQITFTKHGSFHVVPPFDEPAWRWFLIQVAEGRC